MWPPNKPNRNRTSCAHFPPVHGRPHGPGAGARGGKVPGGTALRRSRGERMQTERVGFPREWDRDESGEGRRGDVQSRGVSGAALPGQVAERTLPVGGFSSQHKGAGHGEGPGTQGEGGQGASPIPTARLKLVSGPAPPSGTAEPRPAAQLPGHCPRPTQEPSNSRPGRSSPAPPADRGS